MRVVHWIYWIISAWLGFGALTAGVGAGAPKLVIAITVDQLRGDYLDRFEPHFSTNGFRLLTERGAFMTFARYNYAPTVTGPGHASFLSGCGPAVHGILGNSWFDRRTRKEVGCVADTSVQGVGTTNAAGQASPHRLIGGTLADEMRLQFESKVISLALKDRGAILPAGKKPAGAYWYDSGTARFVSSTHYMTNLPAWVEQFNERQLPQSYDGRVWDRLLPEDQYAFADIGIGEAHLEGETNSVFPHVIRSTTNGVVQFFPTPFGDEFTTEFALAALDAEGLGQRGRPDLLCLSFSSLDGCGHKFGPYSQEVQDHVLRLDRQLERLFNHLDQRLGLEQVMIVLTADHGVAPTVEYSKAMGLDGTTEGGSFMTDLMTRLDQQYGSGKYFLTPALSNGNLHLNHETLRDKQLSLAAVTSFIREYALGTGLFQACFTRDQLLAGTAPGWIGQCVLNGYNPERSGDLVLVHKPFAIPGGSATGTTHGSPYAYDTRVPVLFFGSGFRPGRYADDFHITDIAATLASALRCLEPAGSFGTPCVRILTP
ncbi:MAG: alkaline phosphatase family protein [Verrucomicrobiae bacterium]|nr:alkaline phosphatase family protein [Verrucomicrobiae bacterium]